MKRAMLISWLGLTALAAHGCRQSSAPGPEVAVPEQTPRKDPAVSAVPEPDHESEKLIASGAAILPHLSKHSDAAQGADWFQGQVSTEGSTAYLLLGQLGAGASTLRFVIRYRGPRWLGIDRAELSVEGQPTASFALARMRVEKTADGGTEELLDIHADEIRPQLDAFVASGQARLELIGSEGRTTVVLGPRDAAEAGRLLASYEFMRNRPPGPR
jgi:hypothetical protein